MDFDFQTETITPVLSTILSISTVGALLLPVGTTAQQPVGQAGLIRFNTSLPNLEYHNGTTWVQSSSIASITVTGSTGLTVGGSPLTSSGTITLTLGTELQGLSALATSGIVTRTAAGTYTGRTITGTTSNILVANGDGIAGNPTIDLATAGTAVAAGFVKITTDAYGRVTATTAVASTDIATVLGAAPVLVTGSTMNSGANIIFVGGGTIQGLPLPTLSTDAANKQYVDNATLGLDAKASVKAATIIAGTLATSFANGQVIDGITLVTGDRILIKNQVAASENGIYTVNATGAPTRSTDMNSWTNVPSTFVFVETGGTLADTGWLATADQGGTLNTTSIPWVQFSGGASYTAGSGLTLTGNSFSITAPVTTALGGTGLTTLGAANTVLGVNIGGTAYEAKTVTAGLGISVTPTAGVLTIANTGIVTVTGTANQVTATTVGTAVTLSTPATFVAPGSVAVTTYLSQSISSTVSAAGTTQATATALSTDYNIVSTVAANTGVVLPAGISPFGRTIYVRNTGANTLLVYPPTGGTIDAGIVNAAVLVNIGETLSIVSSSAATWNTVQPNILAGTGVTITNTAGTTTISSSGVTSIIAGTGITVSGATGAVTITNSGVTSVALTLPSFLTVSGSPVTTTGTLTATLASQTANTVFAAPTGAAGTPTFRALVAADIPFIALYRENAVTPTTPIAAGTNAVAIGSGASAPTATSFAVGDGSVTRTVGQRAYANGKFATAGDAQNGQYVLRNITTTAAITEVFLDGATATQRLVIPDNSAYVFDIYVVGRRTDAVAGAAGYRFNGLIRRDTGVATTVITGSVSKTVIAETNIAWDALVTADAANGSIKIQVTGEAAKTIRWVVTVNTTEVTN